MTDYTDSPEGRYEMEKYEHEERLAMRDGQIAMTVHRLGGTVEGAPTHAGNFLQRIDALREIERAALSLVTRDDFWRNAGTLPGEYDNLRDALGMKEET
jgi:hypothetical protein